MLRVISKDKLRENGAPCPPWCLAERAQPPPQLSASPGPLPSPVGGPGPWDSATVPRCCFNTLERLCPQSFPSLDKRNWTLPKSCGLTALHDTPGHQVKWSTPHVPPGLSSEAAQGCCPSGMLPEHSILLSACNEIWEQQPWAQPLFSSGKPHGHRYNVIYNHIKIKKSKWPKITESVISRYSTAFICSYSSFRATEHSC